MADENTDWEERYEHELRMQRTEALAGEILVLERETAEEMIRLIENGHKQVAFILALLFAIISDFADFLAIPTLPLVGDILDVFTAGVLTIFFWNIGGFIKIKIRILIWAAGLFELLPFVINDIVPTYTLGVILAWHIVNKTAREAEKQLEAIEESLPRAIEEATQGSE